MNDFCAIILKENVNKQLVAAMSATSIDGWIRYQLSKVGITDVGVLESNDSDTIIEFSKSFTNKSNKKFVCIIPYTVPYINNLDLSNAIKYCQNEHEPIIGMDVLETNLAFVATPIELIETIPFVNIQTLTETKSIHKIHVKCRLVYDQDSLYEFILFSKERMVSYYLSCGVFLVCADSVMISPGVDIGEGTVILPGTTIMGNSKIGKNCIIGPNTFIKNSEIGDESSIKASFIDTCIVGDRCNIGPYANLRPNSALKNDVKIGDFVEIKNSNIGEKSSVAHLTYIGDSDVGKRVNVGCGVVTVNYDGKNKYRTSIGDDVFIGCNTNLISPVKVNNNAYIAAGSTITDNIPEYALAIAREKQTNKENWVKTRDTNMGKE